MNNFTERRSELLKMVEDFLIECILQKDAEGKRIIVYNGVDMKIRDNAIKYVDLIADEYNNRANTKGGN